MTDTCVHGHSDWRPRADGGRECRSCSNQRRRDSVARKRARERGEEDAPTWENARGIDGGKAYLWLQSAGLIPDKYRVQASGLETTERKLRKWREGCYSTFTAADEVLVSLGVHPSELPEEVWTHQTQRPKGSPRNLVRLPNRSYGPMRRCAHCGKEISHRKPSGKAVGPEAYKTRAYCSRICAWEHQSSSKSAA